MAAIDPGLRSSERGDELLRRGTRIAVVTGYAVAFVVAILLIRPAFAPADFSGPVAKPIPAAPQTDVIRKHETVATFAARNGLELGDLLALNPNVNSLALPAGTKLRVG